MKRMIRVMSCGVLMLVGFSLAGCGPDEKTTANSAADEQDHDHHHDAHDGEGHAHDHDGEGHGHVHPESFAEAVTEVGKLDEAIKTALAAEDQEKADGPVHEIGHLLVELPKLAAKESLSEEDQQQVKQAVDSLMDSFGAVDERIHAGDTKGKTYDEVAETIEAALTQLKSLASQESAK